MMELKQQPKIDDKQEIKPHIRYHEHDYFYSHILELNYCEHCGEELNDEDVNQSNDFMGMFGSSRAYQMIVTGYHCSNCGYKGEF